MDQGVVAAWAGPGITLIIALLGVAVSWGRLAKTDEDLHHEIHKTEEDLREHKADKAVHINSELFEFRMDRLERKVDQVVTILNGHGET